jgi:hypothetical protein
MPSTEKSDLEKNAHVVEGHRTKSLLIVITFLEILSILILIKHREVIDNVHQMLNSILLGILTAGVAQSIIQLYRHVNYNRLLKFCVWGGINGVLSSLWIDTLVLQFEQTPHRIIVDQVVGTPFFQSAFLIFNSVWENHDFYPAFASVSIEPCFFHILLTQKRHSGGCWVPLT